MKILHIGTFPDGGAGLGMMRLHQDLKTVGIESKVLCRQKGAADLDVYGFLNDERVQGRRERRPVRSVLRRLGLHRDEMSRAETIVAELRRSDPDVMVSDPFSRYRLDKCDLVREADIIHLHWVAEFLDWPTFFRHVRKPIVWTIRDENPAIGFWHFRRDVPERIDPAILEADRRVALRKQTLLRRTASLAAVSLSSDMDRFIANSPGFSGHPHCIIPNSIDGTVFRRHSRRSVRMSYGWSDSTKVVLFAAHWLSEKRKGLGDLVCALDRLANPDIVLLCVGNGTVPKTRFTTVAIGPVSDMDRLSAIYSAADLFVSPSKAETFGKTTVEALSCGTPVVSYPNAGALDIVTDQDGVLADDFTPDALAKAISDAFSRQYDPADSSTRIQSRFSRKRVADAYRELYCRLLGIDSQ